MVADMLLEEADVTDVDEDGWTSLHVASAMGDATIIKQ